MSYGFRSVHDDIISTEQCKQSIEKYIRSGIQLIYNAILYMAVW